MSVCKFCLGTLPKGAKKCTACGELCGVMGSLYRGVPLLSIIVAVGSLGIAYLQFTDKQTAVKERNDAVSAKEVAVEAESKALNNLQASESVVRALTANIDIKSKNKVFRTYEIRPSQQSFRAVEKEAERNPDDQQLKEKLILYKAFKLN